MPTAALLKTVSFLPSIVKYYDSMAVLSASRMATCISFTSIMEFLVRSEAQWASQRKSRKVMRAFCVAPKKAHSRVAVASLRYLEIICTKEPPAQVWDDPSGTSRFGPFLDYAIQFLLLHINRSDLSRYLVVRAILHVLDCPGLGRLLQEAATIALEGRICID